VTAKASFELYDLRVEVVVPPDRIGERIYCGARPGDHFELHGEMLHLPPGQGFSIYSLAALLPLAAGEAAGDRSGRLDDDGRGNRLSRSQLPDPLPYHPPWPPPLRARRRHRDRAAGLSCMIPRIEAAPFYEISRLIKGGWHLAGDHGPVDPPQARRDMADFVAAGVTTFDCADIYTGVEALIGSFRAEYPELGRQIQVHTKFVPDLSRLAEVDDAYVESVIDRSLARLQTERIELVQFHWWDYDVPGYVEAALELDRLRRAGKIARIGVTNFDVPHLAEIVAAGVPIATHQLQYSLLDDRPNHGMVEFCRANGIALLCYGTVAGGFISERWLGQPEARGLTNRSLVKYKLIIDDFGGWDAFQILLEALAIVARKHGVDIATVATRTILDRPLVAAAIIGATSTRHLPSHLKVAGLTLDAEDLAAIEAASAGRRLLEGDVYALERDRTGPHGRIMKYELNKED
jgi:aryl-alcohol dehydrogenase-like predicted oxidoreductase